MPLTRASVAKAAITNAIEQQMTADERLRPRLISVHGHCVQSTSRADLHRSKSVARAAGNLSPTTTRVWEPSEPYRTSSNGRSGELYSDVAVLEKAHIHLAKIEPRLETCIRTYGCPPFSVEGLKDTCRPFEFLCRSIIGQQVSTAAAAAISIRFVKLFNAGPYAQFPAPTMVVAIDMSALRGAGLSTRKAEYIVGLANMFSEGALSSQALSEASDEEVTEKLLSVRGLGPWSVDMFLCLGLKRQDVFSTGDIGVQYVNMPTATSIDRCF